MAPEGFLVRLKTVLHIIFCFVVVHLFLLIFLIPIILLLCYRFILSLIFTLFYKCQYKLLGCFESFFGVESYANLFNLYFFMYIDGPCDIELLRQRVHHIFTTFRDKNGSQPYELMLCGLVKKFGFFCWKNRRDSFDIKHHIRYLPGCNDPNRIYTEAEVLDAVGNLGDEPWADCRPKWEFLVVPQLRKDDTGEVCSAIHLRFQHAYVDGVSAAQIIRLCVADRPPPEFNYDPVNPPIPPRPMWMKLVTVMQVFFLGPWALLRLPPPTEQDTFYEGPLTGGKYFGRARLTVSVKEMREIRKTYGCTTSSFLHLVLIGALQKMAMKKGLPVPAEILGSVGVTFLPYLQEYPQTTAIIIVSKFPVGIQQSRERLVEVNRICKEISHPLNYYAGLTTQLLFRIIGVFPAVAIKKCVESVKVSYTMSNVPGISGTIYFNGNNVVDLFGTGPLLNGARYFLGVGCYKDEFTFGFQAARSSLIKNRDDLNELVEEFEQEIKLFLCKDEC